jgi:hypothetical protein
VGSSGPASLGHFCNKSDNLVIVEDSDVIARRATVETFDREPNVSAKDTQFERYIERLPNGAELLAGQPSIAFGCDSGFCENFQNLVSIGVRQVDCTSGPKRADLPHAVRRSRS